MSAIRMFFTRGIAVFAFAIAGSLVERTPAVAYADTKAADSASKPPPTKPSKAEIISDCTKAAYALLATEAATLRALHPGDDEAFARVYAKRKEALVGIAALRTRGCAEAHEDK